LQNLSKTVQDVTGEDQECSKLLADAAWDIKNGFKEIWPDATVLMCWFHASVKIKENAKKLISDESVQKELIKDVAVLQLSASQEIFEKASRMFLEKYKTWKSFVEYFKKQWIDFNPNWYEGISGMKPSTQCAQESTHGKIKQTFTRNERLSMSEMFILSGEIVSNFSLDLLNQKPYALVPEVTTKDLIEGYTWSKKKLNIMRDPGEKSKLTTETWWTAAENMDPIQKTTIEAIKKMKWKSFDQFKQINFSALKIQVHHETTDNLLKITCTCREFLKNFICCHSIGVGINLKYIKVPQEVKDKHKQSIKENVRLPNDSGRQRGRPKKATPALVK
jgi:SWIM zinc finger